MADDWSNPRIVDGFTCEVSAGRLTAHYVGHREEAVIYLDGRPVLFAERRNDAWASSYEIVYCERMPRIGGLMDEISFIREGALIHFLDRVWALLVENDLT